MSDWIMGTVSANSFSALRWFYYCFFFAFAFAPHRVYHLCYCCYYMWNGSHDAHLFEYLCLPQSSSLRALIKAKKANALFIPIFVLARSIVIVSSLMGRFSYELWYNWRIMGLFFTYEWIIYKVTLINCCSYNLFSVEFLYSLVDFNYL